MARARATEIVAGDVLDLGSLRAALRGVSVAYYLVHSMGSAGSFEENDRQSARNFGAAAKAEGVERIIYLGALGNDGETLVRCAFAVGRHSCVRRRTVGLSFAFYAAEPICVLNPTVEVSRDLHQNDWEYD